MLTVTKKFNELQNRLCTMQKELSLMILLLKEAIELITKYKNSSSIVQKFQALFYLSEFSKRCNYSIQTFQELKPEIIILDGIIERDVLTTIQSRITDKHPEQLCDSPLEKLNSMLQELEQLQLQF